MKENEMIEEIIKKEDKKSPLTDEEISEKLGISREIVTKIRNEKEIPNSRDRNIDVLKEEIENILKKEGKYQIENWQKD